MKKPYALPIVSKSVVITCVVLQCCALYFVVTHDYFSIWVTILSFFVSAFVMDLVTGLFHFSFDYVWPDNFPIMGPISVEFRDHHSAPTLDPSAWVSNLTRGAYAGIVFSIIVYFVAINNSSTLNYFYSATLMGMSVWVLFFHQIHSYSHMGKQVSPEEFNATVARISTLPKSQQKKEFTILFQRVGIPKWARLMQRCRIFIRPEVHWRHHNAFDSHFSSLNGWSEPLTDLIFGPIARYKMAKKEKLKAQELI